MYRFRNVLFLALTAWPAVCGDAAESQRPNILWIVAEDINPQLGCYGDTYAVTPNLDRFAATGLRYLHAWSIAPVCAPARTALISGVYPTSTGAEHMRSLVPMPSFMKMYPQFLREQGYYCVNNSKEDYNLEKPGQVWDESSGKAHWKNRGRGQPFFAAFNIGVSHESQIRVRSHTLRHDPAGVRLPAYHPDTPEVRHDWAQYYDKVSEMDGIAGKFLQDLEAAGLAEDTIVFFYGDNGCGMPRGKRWPYNSGLNVPLIIHVPKKFRDLAPQDYEPGGKSERLVGFVDFAPTLLSIVGVKPPEWMQGQAFMGQHPAPPLPYVHGFRGRMDERYDLVRSVRDRKYIYIRNFMPHKIYGQFIDYMFQTPTTRVWKTLFDEGKLHAPQTYFWETKPPEELYDLEQDRDEVRNLAASADHQDVLQRLRRAQREFLLQIRDVGFLPEDEIHARSAGSSPYELGHDPDRYPLERILDVAERASSLQADETDRLAAALDDRDSAVRYWAAMGLLMRGPPAVQKATGALRTARSDKSPSVRVIAALALAKHGGPPDLDASLAVLTQAASLENNSVYVAILALNALDDLGERGRSATSAIKSLPRKAADVPGRVNGYVPRLTEKILAGKE